MKYLFSLLLTLCVVNTSLIAQNESIAPELTGAELIEYLDDNYSVTNPLGYGGARDAMYSSIDNHSGQVTGVYTGYTITASTRGDAYDKGINTEHTWPQSKFGRDEPMRGDIHHLFPTRIEANGARSSYPFDEIPDNQTDKWFYNSSDQTSIPTSNIDDYSELLSGTSFEPREDHKGNTARAIFYFWTVYQDVGAVASNASFFNGMKDVLLQWHKADPVDAAEVQRSLGAEQAQGNRNPFIHDTTLVRRAYFGGEASEPLPTPNPVRGEISNITANSFTITFNPGEQNNDNPLDEGKTTVQINPLYDGSTTITDPDENPVTLADYEFVEDALVAWEEGSSEDEIISTSIDIITFGEPDNPDNPDNPDDPDVVGEGNPESLYITGVIDADLTGGTPKAIELYVAKDIEDLGVFAIGSANNGGGSEGFEFKLSGSAEAGDFLYISMEEDNFNNFFGFAPDFVDKTAPAINGDDAVELFFDSTKAFTGSEFVIDVFGNVDNTNSDWDYQDGWAYRKDETYASGNTFNIDHWEFSGAGALEGASTNSSADNPFPAGTYFPGVINSTEEIGGGHPNEIYLAQNYPNPFNPTTQISYSLPAAGAVELTVFDMLGRKIETMVSARQTAGNHQVIFNAENLSSGIYLFRLSFGNQVMIRKMTLIK